MKFLLLLISLSSFANLPNAKIKNFSGSYADPSGNAKSEAFIFNEINFGDQAEFSVEKQAGVIFLQTPEQEIQIEKLPNFIINLENLSWDNIELNSNNSNFDLKISTIGGSDKSTNIKANNFQINCNGSGMYENFLNALLDSCLNLKGQIKLKYLKNSRAGKKDVTVENLNIEASKNNLSFSVKASGYKVKGYGKVYFQDGKVRLRVDKAKAGILNVKGIIFKELKKLESEKVKIDKPWVTIYLD